MKGNIVKLKIRVLNDVFLEKKFFDLNCRFFFNIVINDNINCWIYNF